MTEGSINRVLYNVDQRADTTAAEKKTARDNIGAIGADEVPGIADDRYKLLQIPTSVSYAANAVVSRLEQDAQGVVSLHCSYLTTATESGDGLMSAYDKLKLDGIQAGAETNVQADWAVNDPASDAYIRNKPSLLQVQSNWAINDPADPSYILNKPDLSVYATQTDLAGKQDTLTAGNNITITNNVISATAAPQEQADWTQSDSSAVDYIKHKPDMSQYATQQDLSGKQDTLTAGQNITITNNVISATAAPQQQADWAQTDNTQVDYIKNKPQNLVQDANYVHTDNNFTTNERDKLSSIEFGAQANVQANWNQSDSSSDSYIQNKPQNLVQDANYVHTDNNFTTAEKTKLSGIEAGAQANVQSDWNQSDSSADDYIKNKPSIPVIPSLKELVAGTGIVFSEDSSTVTISSNVTPGIQYTAGFGIRIGPGANDTTIISNTMHETVFSQVFTLDTLSNSTTYTMSPGGKWRLNLKQLPINTFSNGGALNKVFLGIRYLDSQDIPTPYGGFRFGRTYPYWTGDLDTDMTDAKYFFTYDGNDPYNNGDGFTFSLLDPRDTNRIRPIKQEGYEWEVNSGVSGSWIKVNAEVWWENSDNDAPGNALYIRVYGTVCYPYS